MSERNLLYIFIGLSIFLLFVIISMSLDIERILKVAFPKTTPASEVIDKISEGLRTNNGSGIINLNI